MKAIPQWVHDALDTFELHEKKIKEHGQSSSGRPYAYGKEGWGIRNTAEELHISKSRAANLIIVGRALKRNKLLKDYSFSSALNIAKGMFK